MSHNRLGNALLLVVWTICGTCSTTWGGDEPTPAKRPRQAIAPGAKELPLPPSAGAEQPQKRLADQPVERLRQRYPDGSTMIEREVVLDADGNYVQHGSWKMWDPSGRLVVTGECRDNQFHGTWRRTYRIASSAMFHEEPYTQFQGPLVSEATFDDGMLHGHWIIVDGNQAKISEIRFADGNRHGLATWWFPNGQMMQQIPFRNGTIDGTVKHWTKDGNLAGESEFLGGRQIETVRFDHTNGQLQSESTFLHSQLVLQSSDDWWNARPARFSLQGEREPHGAAVTWYASGQKQSEFHYDHGAMAGSQTWWYEDGQVATTGSFVLGKPDGDWTWYHRNGQKAVAGSYERGATVGAWSWWAVNGTLTRKDADDAVSVLETAPPALESRINEPRLATPREPGRPANESTSNRQTTR